MFKFLRMKKRYKLKDLYVCSIYRITNKILDFENSGFVTGNLYNYYGKVQSKEILLRRNYDYINPLGKRVYLEITPRDIFVIDDLCCKKLHNICDFFDIPDEIFLRGDYLTLEEILEYSKKLKNSEKNDLEKIK